MIVERNAFVVFEDDDTTKLKKEDYENASLVFYVYRVGTTILVNGNNLVNIDDVNKVFRDDGHILYKPRRVNVSILTSPDDIEGYAKCDQFDVTLLIYASGRTIILKSRIGNVGTLIDANGVGQLNTSVSCDYTVKYFYKP